MLCEILAVRVGRDIPRQHGLHGGLGQHVVVEMRRHPVLGRIAVGGEVVLQRGDVKPTAACAATEVAVLVSDNISHRGKRHRGA